MSWLENLADDLGESIENAVESGIESAGQAFDSGMDALAERVEHYGATGVSGALTSLGDAVASLTGGEVDELQLGQSDQPRQLIRGDGAAIVGATDTLTSRASAIESTGNAPGRFDAADWQGSDADAFNDVYDRQPTSGRYRAGQPKPLLCGNGRAGATVADRCVQRLYRRTATREPVSRYADGDA